MVISRGSRSRAPIPAPTRREEHSLRSLGNRSRKMARFFPFKGSAARNMWLETHHDDASANRPAMPDLRESIPIAGRGVDELFRWQAHGLPRARCGNTAVAVPDPFVQPLRVF